MKKLQLPMTVVPVAVVTALAMSRRVLPSVVAGAMAHLLVLHRGLRWGRRAEDQL